MEGWPNSSPAFSVFFSDSLKPAALGLAKWDSMTGGWMLPGLAWPKGSCLPSDKASVPFDGVALPFGGVVLPFRGGDLPFGRVSLPCGTSSAAYRQNMAEELLRIYSFWKELEQ